MKTLVVIGAPSTLAETVTPPRFSPAADVITPVSSPSAAKAAAGNEAASASAITLTRVKVAEISHEFFSPVQNRIAFAKCYDTLLGKGRALRRLASSARRPDAATALLRSLDLSAVGA